MSPESISPLDSSKLFTVPAEDFAVKYRALTREELSELGLSPDTSAELSDELKSTRDNFIQETFKIWKQNIPDAQIRAKLENPATKSYPTLEQDIDPAKAGEYTLNPEVQGLNFETTKIFIPDLSNFTGTLTELAQKLITDYGDKYYLPGIEYWQWLLTNPDKSPAELKDGKSQFLFGSTLRNSDGHWCVPYVRWYGG